MEGKKNLQELGRACFLMGWEENGERRWSFEGNSEDGAPSFFF